jgi:hypothetical protein
VSSVSLASGSSEPRGGLFESDGWPSALRDLPSPASSTVCAPQLRRDLIKRPRSFKTKLLEWVAVLSLILGSEIYDVSKYQQLNAVGPEPGMPAAWERRYYRQSTTRGLELHLIVRGSSAGWWVCVSPDGSLGEVEIGHRKTVRSAPEAGVMYTPQPVMSDEMRTEIDTKARELLRVRGLRKLRRFGQSGIATEARRFGSIVASAPLMAGKWVRWALRGRVRFGGMCAVLFFIYEGLSHWGVFDYVQERIERSWAIYMEVREKLVESSEFVSDMLGALESAHSTVGTMIEPWRVVAYTMSAGFCYWFLSDAQKEVATPGSSPGTSPGTSPASTPPLTPRSDDISKALSTMAGAFEKQTKMLGLIMEGQDAMKDRITETAESKRTAELLREVDGPSGGRDLLKDMMTRIDRFESVLKADRAGPDGAAGAGPDVASGAAGGLNRSTGRGGGPEVTEKAKRSDVESVIAKLKRTAERPHETYLQHLAEYEEVDHEEWATYFPVGYRERVAPSWLGEVYAGGVTGKQFAKDFLRDRSLGDCNEARELIPVMAAIDSLLLYDRHPKVINSISLEKLAKKGYGIYVGYMAIEKREDWKRGDKSAKTWTSKVNEEMWRRIDPAKGGVDELSFTNRKLEDEIRGEVDRDANLLKAFAKLQERQKATASGSN